MCSKCIFQDREKGIYKNPKSDHYQKLPVCLEYKAPVEECPWSITRTQCKEQSCETCEGLG